LSNKRQRQYRMSMTIRLSSNKTSYEKHFTPVGHLLSLGAAAQIDKEQLTLAIAKADDANTEKLKPMFGNENLCVGERAA